ncbi:uncharacterized protein C8R40DRAFT_1068251 [Lentinula edodes]|uniref:uncharacterized protein n=1 Tax=Lentinula edodes TaxID=5353 RepID=UPI001E8D99EA|nr:uncharacterized protein C8R40DRAFT_1068251 [Lentinula edodes]KAH7877034.1 hypothetical protein C8R40DRAFT_1068251 [Lentinula edodes]
MVSIPQALVHIQITHKRASSLLCQYLVPRAPPDLSRDTGVTRDGKTLQPYTSHSRIPSPADGPGFLYAFVDSDVYWKVGMTSDYDRRKAEWDRQCPCPSRVWLPPVRVVWRRKAGASVDLASTALTVCSKAHIEIFIFPGHWWYIWITIVLPVLARAAAA